MNVFEKQKIGEKIKDLRLSSGLSEGDFAKRIKASVADLRKWERGISLPNSKKLDKIFSTKFEPKKKDVIKAVDKVKSRGKKVAILSEDDIIKIKRDAADEAFNRVFATLICLPLEVLSGDGWGTKRLGRFLDKMIDTLTSVQDGQVDVWSINEKIKEKYGVGVVYDAESQEVRRYSND